MFYEIAYHDGKRMCHVNVEFDDLIDALIDYDIADFLVVSVELVDEYESLVTHV